MSVSNTTRKQQVVLDGITSTATFTFRALTSAPTDIKCSVLTNSVTTILTYTTHYTVAINSDGIGGTVTLVAPATTGTGTLTIYRETTNTQESDYDDYNQFPANTLEEDIDKRTMQAQELTEALARCPKLPVESTVTDLDFPEPVAGKGLKWNLTTTGLINTTYNADTEAVAAATSAASALASQLAATTQSTLASLYASTASTQATLAGNYASTASTQATLAGNYASTASTQATTASTQATLAGLYASTASTGALTASTQATLAGLYASTASTQATNAGLYATTSSTQATLAGLYATTSSTQATLAGLYATTASTQAIAAATSATSALAAQTAAEATVAIPINLQTRSYTLILTDVNMMIDLNSAGTINLTIPSSGAVAIPTGSVILLRQLGAGQVVITTSATVTLNVEVGAKITGQYAMAGLLKTATDTWVATGALEA